MNNSSSACDKQSAVASRINNMLAVRKFVFGQDDSHQLEGGGAHVTCLVGYKMVEKRKRLRSLIEPKYPLVLSSVLFQI